jgi:hypothetical protein
MSAARDAIEALQSVDAADTVQASTLTDDELSQLLAWNPRMPTTVPGQEPTSSRRDLLLQAAANRWPNGIPITHLPESN